MPPHIRVSKQIDSSTVEHCRKSVLVREGGILSAKECSFKINRKAGVATKVRPFQVHRAKQRPVIFHDAPSLPFRAITHSLTFKQATAPSGGNGIGVDEGGAVAAEDCKVSTPAPARLRTAVPAFDLAFH